MRNLCLFTLLSFWQFTNAAENDPPIQDSDLLEAAQVELDSSIEIEEDGSDSVAAEISDTNEDEEESSVRFIPSEEISQDFGVSFPVDI
jgi:hypothetical protein